MSNQENRRPFLFYIGNAFILFSIIGFIVTFLPIILLYTTPPEKISTSAPKKGTWLTIPRINARAEVIEQVDPWNEQEYDSALQKGVAHAKGTSLPGIDGTIFLFAHSSGNPWELSRLNTVFFRLGELKQNDTIYIWRGGKEYIYKVRTLKEVWPDEVNYLLDTKKTQLILQTCTPIGTSLKRLLVFADPV